jgi:hypothetical protein
MIPSGVPAAVARVGAIMADMWDGPPLVDVLDKIPDDGSAERNYVLLQIAIAALVGLAMFAFAAYMRGWRLRVGRKHA